MDSVELGTPKGHSRDGFPSCMMVGVSVGKTWRLGSTAGGWNNLNKHLIIWRLVHHHVWCLGGEHLNKLGLLTTMPTCGLASAWHGGLRKLGIAAFTHCTGGYKWGAHTPDCVASCWESSEVLEERVLPESLLWPSWKIAFCHNSQAQYLPVFFLCLFQVHVLWLER